MNRLLLIPLSIGMMCLIMAVVGGVTYTEDYSLDTKDNGSMSINGSDTSYDLPDTDNNFNLWSADGFVAILIIAIAIGAVAGISFLGSGLSEYSQNIVFVSVTYMGVWAVCSLAMYQYVQDIPLFGAVVWLVLTVMYMFGVVEVVQE